MSKAYGRAETRGGGLYSKKQKEQQFGTPKERTKLLSTLKEQSPVFGKKKLGRAFLYTPEELVAKIEEAIVSFSDQGIIPTKAALYNYLGITRSTWADWKNTPSRGFSEIVELTNNFFEAVEEQAALKGQMNPILHIWRQKTQYEHYEKQEYTITVNNPFGHISDPAELNQRLLEDFPDVIID